MNLAIYGDMITENIRRIREDIAVELHSGDSDARVVSLLAVSKTVPLHSIAAAVEAGQTLFGENRVQEFSKKKSEAAAHTVFDGVEVHLIGTLQKNKVRKALHLFSCIQSVDTLALLECICQELELRKPAQPFPLFLQVRSSDYDVKHGFSSLDTLLPAVEYTLNSPVVRLCGLMTIGPFTSEETVLRDAFSRTRNWAVHIQEHFALAAPLELSMGMSDDYIYALREGSTMIRIGSKLFGTRQ